MKILLVRPKAKFQLSDIPIKVEPLELELMAARLESLDIPYVIKDCMISGDSLIRTVKIEKPTHVLFTSYVTSADEIIRESKKIKKHNSSISIMIGGPHAVKNYEDFKCDQVDMVIHSGGTDTILKVLNGKPLEEVNGIFYQKKGTSYQNKGTSYQSVSEWITNPPAGPDSGRDIIPLRDHFQKHIKKWHYLGRKEVALVKTAFGCPFQCEFCYCRLMEQAYYTRKISSVLEEIQGIPSSTIWIVDDTFLIDEKRIRQFVDGIRQREIKKSFLLYSRADFVVDHPRLIHELKQVGVEEIIIGLEAVSDEELNSYQKGVHVHGNVKCIEIANAAGIRVTGLFIFPVDATWCTVKKNLKFVKETQLYNATFSIFTPLKGTALYEKYKSSITKKKSRYFDFLHLVMKPVKIGKIRYMLYFYIVSIGSFYYMMKQRRKRRKTNGNMGLL